MTVEAPLAEAETGSDEAESMTEARGSRWSRFWLKRRRTWIRQSRSVRLVSHGECAAALIEGPEPETGSV